MWPKRSNSDPSIGLWGQSYKGRRFILPGIADLDRCEPCAINGHQAHHEENTWLQFGETKPWWLLEILKLAIPEAYMIFLLNSTSYVTVIKASSNFISQIQCVCQIGSWVISCISTGVGLHNFGGSLQFPDALLLLKPPLHYYSCDSCVSPTGFVFLLPSSLWPLSPPLTKLPGDGERTTSRSPLSPSISGPRISTVWYRVWWFEGICMFVWVWVCSWGYVRMKGVGVSKKSIYAADWKRRKGTKIWANRVPVCSLRGSAQ